MSGKDAKADRLEQQVRFLLEIDRLKGVVRRSFVIDPRRRETDAEHSWHLAVMAMVFAGHADEPVDVSRVIQMVLLHDVVEIDAGDVFLYDEAGNETKAEKEHQAAERIFGLLPGDQAHELRGLWSEFEAHETADARFAHALDRLMPLLHNYYTQGSTWREYGVTGDRVLARNGVIGEGSQALWRFARALIEDAMAKGYLARPGEAPERDAGEAAEPSPGPDGDTLDRVLAVAAGFTHRFPDGDDPFQMMTRLLEESGELAQQVHHFEGAGVKREKHGEPDRARLAKEVRDVFVCAAQVARYYGVEGELAASLERTVRRLKSEGHLDQGEG